MNQKRAEWITALFSSAGEYMGSQDVRMPAWRVDTIPTEVVARIDGVPRDFRLICADRRSHLLVFVEVVITSKNL